MKNKKTVKLITGEEYPLVEINKKTQAAIITVTTSKGTEMKVPITKGFY